jgi:hypothetical protein
MMNVRRCCQTKLLMARADAEASSRLLPSIYRSPANLSRFRSQLAALAICSIAAWCLAIGALLWYLRRMLAEDLLAGEPTDADSIGLPLVSVGILLGVILLLVNLAYAALLVRRRRARLQASSRNAA